MTTSDRELLERAALAAGYDFEFVNSGVDIFPCVNGDEWNPLTDDGDALRLAVNLKMDVAVYDRKVETTDETGLIVITELIDSDQYTATRRAIVRAAAAIGEAMSGTEIGKGRK